MVYRLVPDLLQRCPQRINRQMASVSGLIWQASDGCNDRIAFERRSLSRSQADEHLRHGGAASDSGNAPAGAISGFGNASFGQLERELHDVATSRVLHANESIGPGNLAHVARVLKMVK